MATKYKNSSIWAKFGFQVDYDVANWYSLLVCYGSHFESKIATKIQKSSDLDEIWFPSRFWCWELISMVWEPYYDPLCNAAILKFLSLKIMCTHVRQNFWKISSNSEHNSKPTMNINSQHHNLLGNQISPKSEDFWWPGNNQNVRKIEKHKNDHSRLLAKQKLMKLDKNNIHI
jgi:hypothetical protein